ncbi:hypothetical protein [Polaromonas sp.]|uniref:hypothetical protein n=1 Tax=Polaromonas sp. TaxID=1869339 RepID=UPI00352B7707
MADDIPDGITEVSRALQALSAKNRDAVRSMLRAPEGWRLFKHETVAALRRHAVEEPDAQELAQLLSDTVPAAFVDAESSIGGWSGEKPSANLLDQTTNLKAGMATQSNKLRAAVVEAALVEQLTADGSFRSGEAFSAAKLEEVLDSWLVSGRHRGADFDDAPLSQIAKTMELHSWSGEELMAARFGILIPVVVAIHIWRTLEEYPPEEALLAGWDVVRDGNTPEFGTSTPSA